MTASLQDLIEAQDFNGLLRSVDGLVAARDWDGLIDLAERCEDAIERGKQLWPIAEHVDFRLALEAPAGYAADVLAPGVGRFAPGPLTEVAASTHTWAELAPHIEAPQVAAFVAQERVLRGEVLDGDERAHPQVLELPLHLTEWEPTYALATYRRDLVEVMEPWDLKAPLTPVAATPTAGRERVADDELESALLDLVTPWVAESNGAAQVAIVEGDAATAISALAFGELRMAPLTTAEALQRMAWAAASGGVHGRRRGAALGRSVAWFVASLATGTGWPVAAEDLGAALEHVRWFYWDEGGPEEGFVLRIAFEDLEHNIATALAATDVMEDSEA
ncbi:MAG: hypothetical protein M3161_06860 [Actinomycetota bacterium]|nr:hypothetical protein [Actinomycetota bacterium]